ncbi:hypothetical protein [Sphingorhabdus sp. Alg231-15]|uniref:hypothetical protein n=1 Tax=Sphingorhabdus sp. Alg231-15 TaxID=1922222 RepID=UPI000D55E0E6
MRLALISLSTEVSAGDGPVGMLPLFDATIVERQVRSVRNMGAEKIIFLSPAMHSGLLQYTDSLIQQDIDVEIARNVSDLGQYASAEDDLIFLSDGIFPDQSIEEHLSNQSGELIYVVVNAEEYADFERIDLGHRWLGIALVKADRLSEISQIPDDWDIGSALLRTAVQSECRREVLSDDDLQSDAVTQVLNADTAMTYQNRRLGKLRLSKQNLLDRLVSWPLMRKALPILWKRPESKKYLGIGSIVTALSAIALAVLDWPVVALVFLLIGSVSMQMRNRISLFSTRNENYGPISLFFCLMAAIVLTVSVLRMSPAGALVGDMTVLMLFFGNLWMVHSAPDNLRLNWIRPDISLILIIFIVASGFGFFSIGLYFAALLCLAYLVVAHNGRWSLSVPQNSSK